MMLRLEIAVLGRRGARPLLLALPRGLTNLYFW
jgi:hypothetical protein